MEISGTIKKINETQTFPSGFQKRELVLMTLETYPQPLKVEFLSEKVPLLDAFSEGDEVKIAINLRGREWTNPKGEVTYFNSISGWKIEKNSGGATTIAEPTQVSETKTTAPKDDNSNPFEDEDDDGLPF